MIKLHQIKLRYVVSKIFSINEAYELQIFNNKVGPINFFLVFIGEIKIYDFLTNKVALKKFVQRSVVKSYFWIYLIFFLFF